MSRSSTPKSCKPTGSGRAGLKRRLSASLQPGGVAGRLHSCRSGILKLARRAGVMRIGKGVMDDAADGVLLAFREFLEPVINNAITIMEHTRRMIVTPNDVAMALKQRGITLYSDKADWTYGFYNRQRVRSRVAGTHLTQAHLQKAAEHFAASQAGSAPAGGEQSMRSVQQEAPVSVQRPAAPQPQLERAPQQSPAPSAAHSAAAAAVAGVPTPQAQRPAEQQVAQQQPEEQAGGAAAAVPAAAAKGISEELPALPASVAPQERRLSGVPTPAVVTEARAAEIQNWMAEEMIELQKMTDQLGIRVHDLRRVMVAKHGCHAAEVQHVLFCLEKLDRIMCEEGVIYPCA
ncbi:Histone H4 [Chlorella sorokiniana]|uniref:Histone H4 n=1 Tax=Chlorella sorokiniana TaxID=3076 RepID=A0A2P6TQU4_CHLSO|nr:Histone H4 [Chlorella sorokiniana]PRW56442.1 Histone H4 [Chlorella sorokiniana]|eukprot:PRW05687.1 Histone H4 [Chlorella sorokiniana]